MKTTRIKSIPRPNLESGKRLTPLQLNAMRWDNKHTVLTPEVLEEAARNVAAKRE